MTDLHRGSRWWTGREEPADAVTTSAADPWAVPAEDVWLSGDQLRFLDALVDQPAVPRLGSGIPGIPGIPGIDPAMETGD